jgi:L-lactate dehydrogenase complex protein LldG
MMSARDEILARIRRTLPEAVELPAVGEAATVYDDPRRHFAEVLSGVGGEAVFVPNRAAADKQLEMLPPWASAAKRCTLVEGVGATNFDLARVTDPHDLEDIDFAVLPGQLAVAENGAVWVTDDNLQHRVLYFIPQHLAIVLPADQLVSNLHQAYERIEVGATPFATFISGPSKTADIEQSLVIGAHGARSLTVFLVEDMN